MTCAEYRRWFSPYIDEALEGALRSQLEDHLSKCGSCQHELDALRQMVQSLRAMDQPVSPDLVPGVRAKLSPAPWWRAIANRFLAPWPISLPLHGLALAATALLVVVIANVPGVAHRERSAEPPMQLASGKKPVDHMMRKEAAMLNALEEENMRLKDSDAVGGMDANAGKKQKGAEQDVPGELASYRRLNSPASVGTSTLSDQRVASVLVSQNKGRLFEDLRSNGANMAPAVAALMPETKSDEAPPKVLEDQERGNALVIQASWEVKDLVAAAAQITEWAKAHEGSVVATNDRHLFVTLRQAHVMEFLGLFSTRMPNEPAVLASPWVNISLELVPLQ